MKIRKAEEKDIPRLLALLGQVLQIHAEIRPDVFIPGTTKYTACELAEFLKQEDPSSLFRVSGTQRSYFTTNAGTVPLTLAPKSIRDFRRECALTRSRSVPQECAACIHWMQNAWGLGTAQQAFCNAK